MSIIDQINASRAGGAGIVSGRTFYQSAGRGAAQKNGRQPEGADRSNIDMLHIAEKPAKGKASQPQFQGFSADHRIAMWLEEEIKKAQNGVTTQVVELTPALAEVLLRRNPANRAISAVTVESYARDIANGSWRFNGEPVIVSSDGLLNDGQHRAQAVIDAKTAIDVVLIIGVERDTRTTLDQGKARAVGDYLAMEGHIDSFALAATAGYIWQWQSRGHLSTQRQHRPTKAEMKAVADSHPTIATSLASVKRKGSDAVGGRSMLAFCHWAFALTSSAAASSEFIASLINGIDLSARSPILYARNRLMAERRLTAHERAEIIFRAWNAHRRGVTPKTLPILGGPLPSVES